MKTSPRPLLILIIALAIVWPMASQTRIKGDPELTAQQLTDYITRHNPDFDPAIAECYLRLGQRYGIRGDIALCQAILETGWFRYEGSAVVAADHNYCGLGVERNGQSGNGFATVEEGVKAHIQHLFAYCSTRGLPHREKMVDPRFERVKRGSATTWEDLSGRWAMNPKYGERILDIYARIAARSNQ